MAQVGDDVPKEELLKRIKEAVDAYNPASTRGTRLTIIRYDDAQTGEQVVHGFAYRNSTEARRVAQELERDKVAKFGAQISFVTII